MKFLIQTIKDLFLPFVSVLIPPTGLVVLFEKTLTDWFVGIVEQHPAAVSNTFAMLVWLIIVLTGILLSKHHPWFRWDSITGTWISRFADIRYCANCKTAEKISPLKDETSVWRCMHCMHPFTKPTPENITGKKRKVVKTTRV
jgi:hypothetical protein